MRATGTATLRAVAFPGLAGGACVRGDDVATGLRFVDAEGTVIDRYRSNDGMIELRYDCGNAATDWVAIFVANDLGTTDFGECSYPTRANRVENQGPLDTVQCDDFIYLTDLRVGHLSVSGVGTVRFDSAPATLEALQ